MTETEANAIVNKEMSDLIKNALTNWKELEISPQIICNNMLWVVFMFVYAIVPNHRWGTMCIAHALEVVLEKIEEETKEGN